LYTISLLTQHKNYSSEERNGVQTSKLVCGVIFVLNEERNGVQTSKLVCGVILVLSEERNGVQTSKLVCGVIFSTQKLLHKQALRFVPHFSPHST
jgi:hypothetical protein